MMINPEFTAPTLTELHVHLEGATEPAAVRTGIIEQNDPADPTYVTADATITFGPGAPELVIFGDSPEHIAGWFRAIADKIDGSDSDRLPCEVCR